MRSLSIKTQHHEIAWYAPIPRILELHFVYQEKHENSSHILIELGLDRLTIVISMGKLSIGMVCKISSGRTPSQVDAHR